MSGKVIADELAHGLAGLDSAAGVVRLQNHVVQCEKALIDVRLVPEDVEAGGLDRPLFKRFKQRRFVDG